MKIGKAEMLVTNLPDKNKCVIHIKNLKQKLNHGLIVKTSRKVNTFNQSLANAIYWYEY